MRGRKLKDLVEEGLRRVLDAPSSGEEPKQVRPKPKVSAHDLMKEWCGAGNPDAPTDLSTNKKYFDDFGR